MDLDEYLGKIESKLIESFDIQRDYELGNYKVDLFAEHHMKTEQYILTRKTVINTIETNEFCFIKYFSSIGKRDIEGFTSMLIGAIDKLIDFEDGHMSTYMTGVIVLDNKPSEDILELVKKYKYHKGFAFGFKGWVDIRLILVTMNEKYIVSNKKGKEVVDVYEI